MAESSYVTGETVCLGDIVELDGRLGRIVACLDTGQYSPEFPEEQWAYLQTGVLWAGSDRDLVHTPLPLDADAVFIRRKHEDE
ncbi:MAG TPA: hypothetical protein VK434_04495 [Microvirga sp.]|nr:hypothetical protein [Microvirga sp.]